MDVQEALEKLEQAKSYWYDIYEALREDVRFSIGLDHYTNEEIRDAGGEDHCMIVPVLPQFIHQVVNDMRQNTPSIDVIPGEGEGSDPETAKIFKGLIRNIEYRSNADEVYDTGGEYAVRGGLGFALVDHDYIDDDSELQELKLRRVQNPMSIYLDPSYTECDGSDAEWGIILDPITKKVFDEKYPGKQFVSFDNKPTDPKTEEINLVQVFVKEYEELSSADKKRKLRKVKIRRYKFSGSELLEETSFPGKYVPIVPFQGEEVWDDGKRYLLSLIRNAKSAQRRVNKWAMKESQILDMAPVAPILAPVGSIEDIPDGWTSPDDTIVLRYRMVDAAGNRLDKPERLAPPPIPTGIINAMQGAKESVKEALGMYNASIGQRSNETSGVAIDARKHEGDVATFHFADNRNRSIQHIGRILVCAIPEIYDSERIIQIIGNEENPQLVSINGATPQKGQLQPYDLTKGKYDVRVITGPSYTTKRQETAALMGDAMAKNPQLMQIIGDLYFKSLDVAGADAIAARIKKTIPKELTAEEDAKEGGEQAPDPEKIQMAQIMQQMQAQIQQLSAELENKQGDQQLKQGELQIKAQELRVKEMELQIKSVQAQQPDNNALDVEKQAFDQHIKERELALKEAEFQLKVMQAQQKQPENGQQPVGIKLDTTGFQMMKTPEQEAIESQEAEMLAMQMAEQKAKEDAEDIIKAQQAQALIGTLGKIDQTLEQLTAQVAQPKIVIRDPVTGMIQGVQ